MRFLTDGKTFLGPYSADEIRATARGIATLRADNPDATIYQVTAPDVETARRTWRKEQAKPSQESRQAADKNG